MFTLHIMQSKLYALLTIICEEKQFLFPHNFYSHIYENSVEKGIEMSYNSNVNIAYKSKKQEKERIEYA